MAFEDFFASNLFAALLGAGALYFVYAAYWELTTGTSRRKTIRERGCLEPSHENPNDFMGIGRFLDVREKFKSHKILEQGPIRFARLGNTFKSRILGRSVYMTIEPENLKSMLSTDFKNWGLGQSRNIAFSELLGAGIFSTDGAAWQHSRDLLRPNFHRKQVGDRATFEKHVNDLLDAIPRDGSTVDLQELFFRLTMDSATEFLFGESCGTLKPGLATVSASKFAECFMRGQDYIADHARFQSRLTLLNRITTFNKDRKFVQDFVDGYVQKGLAYRANLEKDPSAVASETEKDGGRYVFLHELCKQTTDPIQIRAELLNILLAGRDTTASLLGNAWHVLARRPDVWAKLKAEVDETLNGEQPTFEQIKDMKYLKAFLNESLRIHPVVPGNARTAYKDTVLPRGGGADGKSPLFIPKNTVVGWSVWTMHRRKDFYGPDADEFKPERWLGENGLRPSWEYLPFNGGPRICIGQQFALTEASYTTIRLIQNFEKVEARDSRPWTEWLTLTLASQYGTQVALTPRQRTF